MSTEYECFCDLSYYDLWCVRPKGERRWGRGYHLHTHDEAQALCTQLNGLHDDLSRLQDDLEDAELKNRKLQSQLDRISKALEE